MKNPLVSILMPVKNAAPYLNECLDSIVNQSYLNWELIAVNDHSTDFSKDILMNYQNKDIRIKVYENNKTGIINALKIALKKSNGTLITRMDADDIMAPYKLDQLVKLLTQHQNGYVATGLVKYFSTSKKLNEGYLNYEKWLNNLTSNNANFSQLYKECVIPSPCWMLNKADLLKIGAFDSTIYPEDYDLTFRMFYGKLKVLGTNKILHYWRDYPERTSRTNANYSNNAFPKIKIHYFIKYELDSNKQLIVWGAGKKSKAIAQLLIQNKVTFSWITNNPKKIGKTIYGCKILDCNKIIIDNNTQLIIAIASKSFQPNLSKATKCAIYRFC